ncbi:hypothetical protein F5X99DRAFT_156131 [Biscogniauxia marginata]|nr:hypothetical protein F5X99DRAFT_156131 [Biscogniauxia marginata]
MAKKRPHHKRTHNEIIRAIEKSLDLLKQDLIPILVQQEVISSTSKINNPASYKPADPNSQADLQAEMADSMKLLVEGIANLFNNPEYADTKIYIGSFELPAHGLVLAVQSPFFKKSLGGNFQESKTKQFRFTEGSAHAHWRVFEYMYTGNYSEGPSKLLDVQDDSELVKDVRVYTTADFFLMDELKAYALDKFKSKLQQLWVSELFVDCIREVYSSTNESDEGIRGAVVQAAKEHLNDLWLKKPFQALVREVGEFAVDLVAKFRVSNASSVNTGFGSQFK